MTDTLPVAVVVRWYTPDEGGRRSGPPPGPRYTPTGRFSDQSLEDMFSVIVEWPGEPTADGAAPAGVTIRPGFPENVPDFAARLSRGDRVILHEGRREVAEAMLRSI